MVHLILGNDEGLVIIVHPLDCFLPRLLGSFFFIKAAQIVASSALDGEQISPDGRAYDARAFCRLHRHFGHLCPKNNVAKASGSNNEKGQNQDGHADIGKGLKVFICHSDNVVFNQQQGKNYGGYVGVGCNGRGKLGRVSVVFRDHEHGENQKANGKKTAENPMGPF